METNDTTLGMPEETHSVQIALSRFRARNDGADIEVTVLLQSGGHREEKCLTVSAEQYYDLKLCKGVISQAAYERLEEAALFYRALQSGERLLAYSANTERMLRQKLMRKGFSADLSRRVSEQLCADGLLNEKKDLEHEVEKCLRKLWGSRRISAYLYSKGFSEESTSLLPELLQTVDFSSRCAKLIRKRYGGISENAEERQRMFAGLMRYGYSASEIKEAVRRVSSDPQAITDRE